MVDVDENEKFTVVVLEAMSTLIISAFSLVAALAWNDAIKALINEFLGADSLVGLFVYAVIVTVIAVLATIAITRAVKKAKTVAHRNDKKE